jgi:hypothetical protein
LLVSDGTRELAQWWTSSQLVAWDLAVNTPAVVMPRLTNPPAVLRPNLFIAARNPADASVQLIDDGLLTGVIGPANGHAVAGPHPLTVFTAVPSLMRAFSPDAGLFFTPAIGPSVGTSFGSAIFASVMEDNHVAVVNTTIAGGRAAAWSPQTRPLELPANPLPGAPVAFAAAGKEGVVLVRTNNVGDLQATRLVLDGGDLLWSSTVAQLVRRRR